VRPTPSTYLLVAAALSVAVASCQPKAVVAPPEPAPAPMAAQPPTAPAESAAVVPPAEPAPPDTVVSTMDVRIGLSVGDSSVVLGGGDALVLSDPAGVRIADVIEGGEWKARPAGGAISLAGPAGSPLRVDALVVTPLHAGQFVRVDGREYRGEVTVLPGPSGLTVVNRLGLESYLAGVLPAEMGRREPIEEQALYAQAVVSRTFIVRNQGKRRALGFDLYASVADQVYGGVAAENAMGWEAVRGTRAEILTWQGRPIDAFFYSTCGGRTESGTAVFQLAGDPYLRSIADVDADGLAYCRISPRFRWHEEYEGDSLEAMLRRTLPGLTQVSGAAVDRIAGVRVSQRTASGRVDAVEFRLAGRTVTVTGQGVRRAFLLPDGQTLRSTAFDITERGDGGTVAWLGIDGRGAGHGVGFCQWGAVGRAREGQDYRRILAAYYPSTRIEQLH